MTKGRIEAFSDGVIAIIVTIMVLELRPPKEWSLVSLKPIVPTFLAYVLSFINVGIYWNNHHHLFQTVERVNGRVLWANLYVLFWLSLIPFATSWMGNSDFAQTPVIVYGGVLIMAASAYYFMTKVLLAAHGPQSTLARALSNSQKEMLSLLIYALSLVAAFYHPVVACLGYGIVALIWMIPDTRIETLLHSRDQSR